MDYVNTYLFNKEYGKIVDMFLGSGNFLMNIHLKAEEYIGIDIIPLMPIILRYMVENELNFSYKEIKEIVNKWGFDEHNDYYEFRDYWNSKYMSREIDKDFVYETVLLLKMCNNSMVRFNKAGEFNQGFRGIGRGKKDGKFFTRSSLRNIPLELNSLYTKLQRHKYKFYGNDYKNVVHKDIQINKNDLVIIDPPYLLSHTKSYGGNFGETDEEKLLIFIENLKCDFILFNYLENNNNEYSVLKEWIEKNKYKVTLLSTKGKLKHISKGPEIKEVMISNIG